jgi:hypothetical protein
MRLALASLLLVVANVHASEGMWPPQQLPEIRSALAEAGLTLDPDALADLTGHPMGAIVSLGGCTASFVSSQGLVVTNHHCALGAIQLNSSTDRNLLETGFNAATLADEVSAGPSARVLVTESIRDVTADIERALVAGVDDRARFDAIDAARKSLVAQCEREPGFRCTVYAFHGGLTYRLFRQLEITDVRLVYAPPGAIGNFGGDVDNWMWPRHTGDFSFLRAYVGRDGKPAPFATDNVPYAPKHHLRIAAEGLKAGDFAMAAGYPGVTFRNRLADEIGQVIDWGYPVGIAQSESLIALVEAAGQDDPSIAIKYASYSAAWNNGMKNQRGQLDGFARAGARQRKQAEERAFLAWLAARGEPGRAGLDSHAALQARIARSRATRERDQILGFGLNFGLLDAAKDIVRNAAEREKPDAEREAGYQARDEAKLEGDLRQLEKRLDPGVDRRVMGYWLQRHVALPHAQRVAEIDTWLGGADDAAEIDARLAPIYAGTGLVDTGARLRALRASRDELTSSTDPLLQLVHALMPAILRLESERKSYDGAMARLQPAYLRELIAYRKTQGRAVYPDANGSLRITFGKVGGYSPRDGIDYRSFTTLSGIREKHTGVRPFDAGQLQLAAIDSARYGGRDLRALGGVPVNFLTDLDVTGGNSGSATLNARGELVGLLFDMTWDSVASNWLFNPALTRTIHVDIRYLLWVMEQVEPAPRLLREMDVVSRDGVGAQG